MQGKYRVIVSRSNRHMSAQIVNPFGLVLGGISTKSPSLKKKFAYSGNKEAAKEVGVAMAAILKKLKISENIAFDRSGYWYHGRVAMVAEGLRSSNIKI